MARYVYFYLRRCCFGLFGKCVGRVTVGVFCVGGDGQREAHEGGYAESEIADLITEPPAKTKNTPSVCEAPQHAREDCSRRAVMLAVVPGAQRVLVRQVRRKSLSGSYHHPGAGVFVGASIGGTRVPPHLDGQCRTTGIVRRLALRPRSSR